MSYIIILVGVVQVITGALLIMTGRLMGDVRQTEKSLLRNEIRNKTAGINIPANAFFINGSMATDTEGNTKFYAQSKVDNLISNINEVTKQ